MVVRVNCTEKDMCVCTCMHKQGRHLNLWIVGMYKIHYGKVQIYPIVVTVLKWSYMQLSAIEPANLTADEIVR